MRSLEVCVSAGGSFVSTTFAFVRVGVSVRFIPVSVGQWCGTFAR